MVYEATIVNKNYSAGSADEKKKHQNHYLQPQLLEPAVYWDPMLGPSSLFAKPEILLDNKLIVGSQLEDRNYMWQKLNRILCKLSLRRKKYASTLQHWIATSQDHRYTPAVPAIAGVDMVVGAKPVPASDARDPVIAPNLLKSMRSLIFDGPYKSKQRIANFGMDGKGNSF